jgi:hypothetical protein
LNLPTSSHVELFQVSKAKDCLTEAIDLLRSLPAHSTSADKSTSTGDGAAAVSVARAHIVLAQLFKQSGDVPNATKHLIAHLHMLLSPLGSQLPLLPPPSQSTPAVGPEPPTLFQNGITFSL